MPIPFRPRLEALDARDLLSVTPYSFALSNGTLVSGSFDYADAVVDPALASQQVPVSDLTVALNGQSAVLPLQLSAATATFAQGQFQGLALTAVAVAGDVAAFINTASTFAPISVSVSIPPVGPITPPEGGIDPLGWAEAIEAYNTGCSILDGAKGVLQRLMDQHDARKLIVQQAFDLLTFEPNTVWQAVYNAYWETAKAELLFVEGEVYRAYTNYQALYQSVQAQYQSLLTVLTAAQQATLTPLPTLFVVPPEYYDDYLLSIA